MSKIYSPIGDSWEKTRNELLSPEERKENDIKVSLVGEILKARKACGMTQKDLEMLSGVKQPVIARL